MAAVGRIRAVVFDLDGTLVDSHRDIATALNEVLSALGAATHPPERVKTMIGHGVRTLLSRALGTDDRQTIERGRALFKDAYERCLVATTRPYAGIPEALAELGARGLTIALATNKPKAFTDRVVKELALDRMGVAGWASSDEAAHKPDPAVVALALERAGFPPGADKAEVAYAGDMPVDVETARRFGCLAVGAGWGFMPEELRAAAPDVVLADPAELVSVLAPR